ncbi:MAG: transcriptional regulator [Nitrososphaeria archaeon]
MNKDQLIGLALLIGSIVGIVIYGYLLYNWATIILQVTAFLIVAGGLVVVGWIGYTLATTPPPTPIEELSELSKDEPAKDEKKEEKIQ